MSDTQVRILKWVGYPLFALFSFFAALYLLFPYDKVKTRLEDFANASGEMELRIGSMGPSPLTGVKASDLILRFKEKPGMDPAQTTAPGGEGEGNGKRKKAPAPASRLVLDEVAVSVGLLALLSGGLDVDFAVEGMGGTLEGAYEANQKTKAWSLEAEAEGLKLGSVKMISDKAGLPIAGGLSSKVQIKVPKGQMNEASGAIELTCENCSVGDGKKKLKVKGHPFLAAGITLPRLRLGTMAGKVKVDKGIAKIQSFSAKSPDLELKLEGSVSLRQPIGFSNINAYIRFKVSPQLKEKNPAFGLLDSALGSARRPDGFFGMRVMGSLMNPKFMPSRVGLSSR